MNKPVKPSPGGTRFALQSSWRRSLLMLSLFFLVMWQVPHRWAGRQAGAWYRGDPALIQGLSATVQAWVARDIELASFKTGSERFDGEWLFGTYLMAGFGFCQEARLYPDRREALFPVVERCIEQLLSDEVKAFDIASWHKDPIENLDSLNTHHAAYLGYMNLLMSAYRAVNPESRFSPLNDQITDALARRLEVSGIALIQTYPHEVYPVDNCAVIAGIGLHERVAPAGHAKLVARCLKTFREQYVDPDTGLVIQAVDFRSGRAIDDPRGSGTALGLYFLSFVEPKLSAELFAASRDELAGHFMGFGGMREYPRGVRGTGDIDSGPILFGFGMSPTGFSLAGCRLHGDPELFRDLFATLQMCGAPLHRDGRVEFVSGGPLGNAISFAMLTATLEEGE